jgi:hypothetical protein
VVGDIAAHPSQRSPIDNTSVGALHSSLFDRASCSSYSFSTLSKMKIEFGGTAPVSNKSLGDESKRFEVHPATSHLSKRISLDHDGGI